MIRLAPFLALAGLLSAASAASAESAGSVTCKKLPGYIAGPFAPDEETARAIFLAVEPRIFPARNVKGYPVVEVIDEGDSWSVFRTSEEPAISDPETLPDGRQVITMRGGDGQLGMTIDKCSGRISKAAFMR